MATFWFWGVRNLFVALAGLVAYTGYKGVADWSITLMVVLGLAFVAEVGGRFGRRAAARKRRKTAAKEALLSAAEFRERIRASEQRRVA